MFVYVCGGNEIPCCHTKHRNFPVLTSAFCVCVFPSYDPLINASQLVLDFPEGRGLERMECYLLTTVLTPSEGFD